MTTIKRCSVCGEKMSGPLHDGANVSHMNCAKRDIIQRSMSQAEILNELDSRADALGLEYSEEFSDDDIYYELYHSEDESHVTICADLVDLLIFVRSY
jgi:hypothetical protein